MRRTGRRAHAVEESCPPSPGIVGIGSAPIGRSAEGRDIWMVIASREGAATPEGLRRNGRPILLAHAGIHSGEIDGKDAGMMLLRDMTVGGANGVGSGDQEGFYGTHLIIMMLRDGPPDLFSDTGLAGDVATDLRMGPLHFMGQGFAYIMEQPTGLGHFYIGPYFGCQHCRDI